MAVSEAKRLRGLEQENGELKREGLVVNPKRTRRLHREEVLQVRGGRRKKLVRPRLPMPVPVKKSFRELSLWPDLPLDSNLPQHCKGSEIDAMDSDTHKYRAIIAEWKFRDEGKAVAHLLEHAPCDRRLAKRIESRAAKLVTAARADAAGHSLLDTFLAEYGLGSQEGIALMCLAESLLRIPDRATAEKLIADRIGLGDWAAHAGKSGSLLVNASTWALMLGSKLVQPEQAFAQDPKSWLGRLGRRLGEPIMEAAMRAAMGILGREFVAGSSIENALRRSEAGARYSWDMLGEAARDAATASRYRKAYHHAIRTLAEQGAEANEASLSIKLSALHPRHERSQRDRVMTELVPAARELCRTAADAGIAITLDAEEADRLELSMEVFERLSSDQACAGARPGFVVQAYGKRALPLLDWLAALGRKRGRRIPVRLVKGAYWDFEIKHAQALGYPGFPVYTRKCATDLSWLVCAARILQHADSLCGQFATHNAHGVAAVMQLAGKRRDFEFQRLHGMGQALYATAGREYADFPALRTYAPVGKHDDLLPYLLRRLLENGANSSFVHRLLDAEVAADELVADPVAMARAANPAAHPRIALPGEILKPRRNSAGADLTSEAVLREMRDHLQDSRGEAFLAHPLPSADAAWKAERKLPVLNPANRGDKIGEAFVAAEFDIEAAFSSAQAAWKKWDESGGDARADLLENFADRLEARHGEFIALLCREAGKTIPDAVDEVREAVDFCRYYAAQAREHFAGEMPLPGPTGENNRLRLGGRGVFVCISPWNFPLAIFCGQVCAALAAGNAVLAKPAEEAPLVAFQALRLMHEAGIPQDACHLLPGDGAVGAGLVRHPLCAGVAFTGGMETARDIHLALARKPGAIVPLIAETGGQNAMIVDSTALLEQVTDDVIRSAFGSAGQRCSALRVLYLQEEIAEPALAMIRGAMDELRLGDPARIETDVGPIISEAAAKTLRIHIEDLRVAGRLLHQIRPGPECERGIFVPPALAEIGGMGELQREHFGPILHVVRFAEGDFSRVLEEVNRSGSGLTFGVHTRIASRMEQAAGAVAAGNIYVNRNMIGAVVGSQPFGGRGLSGTGPKAGGPNYLPRFATEKTVTVNTAATGGNAELLSLSSD